MPFNTTFLANGGPLIADGYPPTARLVFFVASVMIGSARVTNAGVSILAQRHTLFHPSLFDSRREEFVLKLAVGLS
jgi:hypothetical protein